VIDPQSQKQIREDIARLYEMASELKGEVERTDANSTLSVSLVKKAQQIEKTRQTNQGTRQGLTLGFPVHAAEIPSLARVVRSPALTFLYTFVEFVLA